MYSVVRRTDGPSCVYFWIGHYIIADLDVFIVLSFEYLHFALSIFYSTRQIVGAFLKLLSSGSPNGGQAAEEEVQDPERERVAEGERPEHGRQAELQGVLQVPEGSHPAEGNR